MNVDWLDSQCKNDDEVEVLAGASPGFFKGGVTLCQGEGTHKIVTMAKVSSGHFCHLL